jgi:hypothetical protein
MLRSFSGERDGRDLDAVDAGGLGADFDLGNSGDDLRRPDHDIELVGTGAGFLVDVGAADVGVRGEREEQCEQREDS